MYCNYINDSDQKCGAQMFGPKQKRQSARGSSSINTSRELCDVRFSHDSDIDADVIHVDRSSSPPIVVSDESTDLSPAHCECRHGRPTADVHLDVKPRCQSRACSANLNESFGSSSRAGSAASEARSRCLEHQLSATLQVLRNKEETVRVQAESLALAEARIAALAARADHPLHSTRSSADGCCVDTAEVPAQTVEADGEGDSVSALRDNLAVIEHLYRECFYERAQQEELMDLLRESCHDVRRRERLKDARIGRLQRSLDSCRDVVVEVENLKSEISNFLNSSNHDSGMWERPEEPLAADVTDELHYISGQLLQLRNLLADGCSCGLQDENMKLKRVNEKLEMQLGELRHRVSELEVALQDKENVSLNHQHQIQLKDQELSGLQQQLSQLEAAAADHRASCSELHAQVQHLQVVLQERSGELSRAQRQCQEQAATADRLREDLARAESGALETEKVRSEVSQLSAAVSRWREQLADSRRRLRGLDEELQRERRRRLHLEHHCQAKAQQAATLQTQLEEARARGAALCGEAQRAVSGVRRWLRRARDTHRKQEQTIEEQDKLIRSLRRRQSECSRTSSEEGCSRRLPAPPSTSSCSCCPSRLDARTSGSDAPSPSCDDQGCQWPSRRHVSSQRPARADAHTRAAAGSPPELHTRGMSPTAELLERVDRTHEALAEARRRWRRGASAEDLPPHT